MLDSSPTRVCSGTNRSQQHPQCSGNTNLSTPTTPSPSPIQNLTYSTRQPAEAQKLTFECLPLGGGRELARVLGCKHLPAEPPHSGLEGEARACGGLVEERGHEVPLKDAATGAVGAPLHGLHLPRHLEDLVQRVPVELLRLDYVAQARGDMVLLRRGGGAGGDDDGGGSATAQARGGGGREGQTGAAAGGGREREVGPREGGASGGGHGRGEARRVGDGRGLGFSRFWEEQGAAGGGTAGAPWILPAFLRWGLAL